MKNKSLGLYNIIDTEGINKSINNVLSSRINFNTYTSPKGLKELRMQISNFLYDIWNYNVNYICSILWIYYIKLRKKVVLCLKN